MKFSIKLLYIGVLFLMALFIGCTKSGDSQKVEPVRTIVQDPVNKSIMSETDIKKGE